MFLGGLHIPKEDCYTGYQSERWVLNVAKTESVVIASGTFGVKGQRIQITYIGTAIKAQTVTEFSDLGVLGEHLTWNLPIDEACSKVLKRINLLKAIKTYLRQCARQLFYREVSNPTYCWFRISYLGRNIAVQPRLQKYATRVIHDKNSSHQLEKYLPRQSISLIFLCVKQ